MSLIIKNIDTVNVTIGDIGITLVPSDEYDLTQERAVTVVESTDLVTALVGGQIQVLDPLDDATPLSLSDAQAALAAMNDTHFRIRGGLLDQIDDVTINSISTDQTLTYTGSGWENQDPPFSFGTINGDTGSSTATTYSDTLTLAGDTGLDVTASGTTLTIAPADDLAALEGLSSSGLAVRTGADTWATRTLQGTTDQITVTNGAGVAGDPVLSITTDPVLPGNESVQIPAGTTAQRPSPASNGMVRYNTSTNKLEGYENGTWQDLVQSTGTFGTEYTYAESNGVSTTSSTTFQTKVTMNTASLPAGNYHIGWSYQWNLNSVSDDFLARVVVDGNTGSPLTYHQQEPNDSLGSFSSTGSNQRHQASGFSRVALGSGTHTVTIQWATEDSGTDSSIWNARLELWRVS